MAPRSLRSLLGAFFERLLGGTLREVLVIGLEWPISGFTLSKNLKCKFLINLS